MWKVTLFVLVTLAAAVGAEDTKYSDLKEHVIGLGLEVSYKTNGGEELTPYVGECPADDKECQVPVFTSEDEHVLVVKYTAPKAPDTLKKFEDTPLTSPTKIEFKACYATKWTADRKWRKAKDVISGDKRCGKKMGTEDFAAGSGSMEFKIPTDTPSAEWFITALLKCPKEGSDDLVVCGYDTTGVKEKHLEPATNYPVYYETKVVDSRTTGLYIAVVVCSVASVSLLVGFFVFEQMTRKNK